MWEGRGCAKGFLWQQGKKQTDPRGRTNDAQVNPSKTVGLSRGSLGFPDWRT